MDYLSYKPYERDPEALRKSEHQAATFQDADLIAAVGPKLYETVRDLAPHVPKVKFVPGCEDMPEGHLPERFSLMISGRLSDKTDPTKQHRAAVVAFADCVRERQLGQDPVMTVLGAEPDAFESMSRAATERAKGVCGLVSAGVVDSPARYVELLGRQAVVVIPSIYEGFSLVGWEALSAGIPIILSQNTGLAKFVDEESLRGLGIEMVDMRGYSVPAEEIERSTPNEQDVRTLRDAYVRVYATLADRKANALETRDALRARYRWSETASRFVGDLTSTLEGRYNAVALGITSEGESIAGGALSLRVSAILELASGLKYLARSVLVPTLEKELVEKAHLERVSDETLARLLVAWMDTPWDLYVSYSASGKSAECVGWLLGMTVPVKGRAVLSVSADGIDAASLDRALISAIERARPETPHPRQAKGDDERLVSRAVSGLARRVVAMISSNLAPPPWLLVMDPRLRTAVDVDAKKLHWRKDPIR